MIKQFRDRVEWLNDQGQRHREGAPAIEWFDGDREWWVNGKLHRLDGPAAEYSNGSKAYYVDGVYCSKEAFEHQVAVYKLKRWVESHQK